MTQIQRHEDKYTELWREMLKAFNQAQWFGSYYYQNHLKSCERKVRAYDAKYGPFVMVVPQ